MNVVRSQTAVAAEVLSGWTVSNRCLDLQVIFSYQTSQTRRCSARQGLWH